MPKVIYIFHFPSLAVETEVGRVWWGGVAEEEEKLTPIQG